MEDRKNPIKFRLMSTGKFVFAELDGKTIGPGVCDIQFNARDEEGSLHNQLKLSIDLNGFEFLPDGTFDENYKKYSEIADKTASSEHS